MGITLSSWRKALVVVLMALSSACSSLPYPDRTPNMKNLPPKIANLFQKTKTVCFGRFMMEVPESATLAWGTASVPYDLEVYPGEGPKLKAQIQAKVDEIRREAHKEEPSMLIGVFDSVNPESKIVVRYYNEFTNSRIRLFSYIRLGDTAFVQTIPSMAIVVRDKSDPDGIRTDKTLYRKYVAELTDIARGLRLRAETEIPEEEGVCIEQAFVRRPLDFRFESIPVGFYFPEIPDVNFSVLTRGTGEPDEDDTLEAGLRESRQMARAAGLGGFFNQIETLRQSKRMIGKWEGAEALMRVPNKEIAQQTHEFFFVSPGVGEDLLRPRARVAMYTGVKEETRGKVAPSLSDIEAIALWDKLTSSIRVRPVSKR